MKKLYCLAFVVVLISACKKEHAAVHPTGQIVRTAGPVTSSFGHTFGGTVYTAQDSATVAGLMKANNLSTDGFVFYTYQSYNALDENNKTGFFQLAEAMQVRNGLPVFFEDITFAFEDGKMRGPYPAPQFIAGNITLDNKPSLALSTLKDTFIKLDNEKEASNISIGDSTLVAQLGYYNLNINQRADGVATNYIKLWYIHPQHSSLPEGYIRDDNGTAISFKPLTRTGPIAP